MSLICFIQVKMGGIDLVRGRFIDDCFISLFPSADAVPVPPGDASQPGGSCPLASLTAWMRTDHVQKSTVNWESVRAGQPERIPRMTDGQNVGPRLHVDFKTARDQAVKERTEPGSVYDDPSAVGNGKADISISLYSVRLVLTVRINMDRVAHCDSWQC